MPSAGNYDVVIAGGSPAGCVLASRLTADPGTRVLLLEAGPDWRVADAPPEMHAHRWTAYAGLPALEPFHRWDLTVRHNRDLEPTTYLGGRGLGGSSTINALFAFRPPLEDFDGWRSLGATRWSSDMALALLRRVEADREFGGEAGHGADGPFAIERTPASEWGLVDHAFVSAAGRAGFSRLDDLNGSAADGVGALPYARSRGQRVSANHAYLEPVRGRPNLEVLGGAWVDRVLFGSGDTARGVRFHDGTRRREVSAGEVVLSAGTLGSAGILMRSGIGQADDLTQAGMAVRADLPVGARVQDHPMFQLMLALEDGEDLRDPSRDFGSTALCYSSGIGTAAQRDLSVLPMCRMSMFGLQFPPSLVLFLWEPRSSGTLRPCGSDPRAAPDYDAAVLADAVDLERMRAGVRLAASLLQDSHFAELHPQGPLLVGPGMASLDTPDDDAALDRALRQWTVPQSHVSCSAPMGREGDAVVDAQARVFGFQNLRVADLSICPRVPRGSAYLTSVLIGEFVSDLMTGETDDGKPPERLEGQSERLKGQGERLVAQRP